VHVLAQLVKPAHAARIPRLFLQERDISELTSCFGTRHLAREAARHQPLDGAIEMVRHLDLHLTLDGSTREKRSEPSSQTSSQSRNHQPA
jgi:hypothetical protein